MPFYLHFTHGPDNLFSTSFPSIHLGSYDEIKRPPCFNQPEDKGFFPLSCMYFQSKHRIESKYAAPKSPNSKKRLNIAPKVIPILISLGLSASYSIHELNFFSLKLPQIPEPSQHQGKHESLVRTIAGPSLTQQSLSSLSRHYLFQQEMNSFVSYQSQQIQHIVLKVRIHNFPQFAAFVITEKNTKMIATQTVKLVVRHFIKLQMEYTQPQNQIF